MTGRHSGSGDGFVRCSDGHVRWGVYGAAGALFVTRSDQGEPLVMLQLRSGFSHEGGTWSCAGGALDHGETPLDGALREAAEEVGAPNGPIEAIGQYVFAPATDWTYTTVVVQVEAPFGSSLNFETDAVAWVAADQVEQRPLHAGFAAAWPHLRTIIDRQMTSGPAA
ncbi:MAG: mutX [Ilumatobacteraceae bacterium]|nr:mutX [Ilumatobacteraceae bacterium]